MSRDFKNYKVWELSHKLTLNIYSLTESFPNTEKFGITSQIRRAASSIPTNISEGCGRDSELEFNRFLTIAQGSASEVEYLLILCKDLKLINEVQFSKLSEDIDHVKRMIYNLKTKLITK